MKQFAGQSRAGAGCRQAAARQRPREKGYILLTLLLVVALMAIFALTVITEMKFTIKRDQEQEMIHRGVQYSRAIRGYYKKFGRYPTRLEDLENTNNQRYLRKRYKDPVNKNQDFRLLHFGEQGVTLGSGGISLGGGVIPGANPVGAPGGLSSGPGNSAFGGSTFGNSGSGVNNSGVFAQSSGFGANSNSGSGANSNPSASGSNTPGTNPATGTDSSSSLNSQDAGSSAKISSAGASDQSSGQQPVSGGPIVGVASVSKNTTIREFNKKKKYNEWQFVYDPTTEPRNGLITTPNQPLLQGFGTQPLNGTQPGNNNGSAFGSSNGYGNNSNSSGSASPTPPPANPPPQ